MKNQKNLLLIIYSYDAPEEELLRRRRVIFDNNVRRTFTKYCDYEPEIKQEIERRIIIQNQSTGQRCSVLSINKARKIK